MIRIIKTDSDFIKRLELGKKPQIFPEEVTTTVRRIIEDVAKQGDMAVKKYSALYDGFDISRELKLSQKEIEEACSMVENEAWKAIAIAIKNIGAFHLNQLEKGWTMSTPGGSILGNIVNPLKRVAVYVPGGTAAYPSSVIMNVVPAQIAGVQEISLFTPPDRADGINKYVAAAAYELGIDSIYRVGGAQAVAAAAFGTETIRKVDKIVGPGNIYVAAAKREVYGAVDIDMIAGPSEILIIADSSANPCYIAADMLSQAEHDELAKCVLITDSWELAQAAAKELEEQLKRLERRSIAEVSLQSNSYILVVDRLEAAVDIANEIAPEHLELVIREPDALLPSIKNAGAIFVGEYSPEPIGDYIAGPNHVLPTSGTARFFSPLSVKDFLKTSSLIRYSAKDFYTYAPYAALLAEREGLTAHANSLKVRLQR